MVLTLNDDFDTARMLTQDDPCAALRVYEKIIQQHPEHIPSYYNAGQLAAKLGNAQSARIYFEKVVELQPDFAQGHFQLAQILLIEEKNQAALDELIIATALVPEYKDAQHLLACSAMQQQQYALAEKHFQQLLAHAPDYATGYLNFALLRFQQQQLIAAKTLLETALSIDPMLIEAHYHLGVIAMQQGDIDRAILQMQETLDRNSEHFAANYNLAILYKMQNHYQLATHYLTRAQQLKPQDENIAFLLSAFANQQNQTRAPKPFVQELFNHYAETYDTHMQKSLRYQVPELLRALITPHLGLLPQPAMVLDLGCGTGLVGEQFKDLDAQFIGVDLANEMLLQAKARDIYQHLHQGDIIEYLHNATHTFDLIIAGDVFGYLGALDEIFAAATLRLRVHGLFLFSIETDEMHDYHLQPYARYTHHINYIERLCAEYGFKLLSKKSAILRYQENKTVNGELFLAQLAHIPGTAS